MTMLAENKKAFHNYEILETFEAGIALRGFEVKAVKAGRANIAGTHVIVREHGSPSRDAMAKHSAFLVGADIPPYQPANTPSGYDPTASRRLLLTRKELAYLLGKMKSDRLTAVPLSFYTKGRLVKLKLALVRGKRHYEKREAIRKREVDRVIRRTLKN